MSQNSLVINDGSGAAILAAITAALDSLASLNSGAGSPATTYPYMLWPDTANGVLRQRNAANTGWIVRAPLAETLVVSRAANAVLAAADFGRTIIASGSWTQTFNAASTLGDGWFVEYRNNGSGIITLDPNGSETIDGATTLQLAPGETCCIYSNGTALYTLGRTAAAAQSQQYTAFTTAGVSGTFTLAPVPALTSYAAGQRFRIKLHAAGNGADTLNVSGLGAKSLKQYDSTGAKAAAVLAANQLTDVEYDGVDFVVLDSLPVPASMAAASVQTFVATGTLPATVVGGTAIINSASATTQTLPAASTVSAGRRIELLNIGAGIATVSRAGVDTITVNASNVTTLALGAGDTLTLESNGATGWYAVGGSAQLGYAGVFGVLLAASGYQKLPSGLIIQWGKASATVNSTGGTATVTLPIAFPTTGLSVVGNVDLATVVSGGWATYANIVSTSQIKLVMDATAGTEPSSGTYSINWIAIGY